MNFFGSKDIKVSVNRALRAMQTSLRGKTVIDIPAGSGVSTATLLEIGADVRPYDLFPELFTVDGIRCNHADLASRLPIEDRAADVVLCQEGIEHLSDQLFMLREMNRILTPGGKLLLTTPNYSNLRARMSYFLCESEYYKLMPPNIVDSIWFAAKGTENRFYFGHIFLLGIQKLNILARLSGFRIKTLLPVRVNYSSAFLFLFTYPFIVVRCYLTYRRAMRKNKSVAPDVKREIYWETVRNNIDPRILLGGHLFVEFEKLNELDAIESSLQAINKTADFRT